MAQSAETNLKATATVKSKMSQLDKPHCGRAANKIGLLDTLKAMTHTCNKRMQDVNDCRASHQDMLETGHEYPAGCELDRMDRMVARLQKYWQKMKYMWQNNNLGDATVQPNMYHLEVTRSSVESRYCTREHLLDIRQ